jgi:hypothetical protein
MPSSLTRRQFMSGVGGTALAATAFSSGPAFAAGGAALAAGAGASGFPSGAEPASDDTVAAAYYQYLLRHTNWAQQQWDATAGHYAATDYNFAVVLGNAVLLTHGSYDASVAGVDAATLKAQTLATISHFAASNVLNGGSEWGETMFFDSTFELYFILAAKLLWDELDAATQTLVDQMAAAQAAYTTALGTGDDPRSPSWSPNGLAGNWEGDTKVDEMAVYAQCLGPAVAWLPQHPDNATWSTWLTTWMLNDTGLPPADQANPTVVDGRPISAWNTAHNIFDTFFVENHGSFEPHYQLETWRMSARVAAHFLAAGLEIPAAAGAAKPSAAQLWRTIRRVQSDSGEPFMPMDADRYHLFGRDVVPLAFLAQIMGDPEAARAEANMAAQLGPYQLYPPEYQLTKFSGEAKYEPEARAELAISYLFHVWRAHHAAPVIPVSQAAFVAAATGTTDYGSIPGMLAQNSPNAFAAAISKPSYVKFVYAPNHDDWLFAVSGSTTSLLPSTSAKVTGRFAAAYSALRDGFDATAALLTLSTGYAGYATLPGGSVVYTTSGTGAGEGVLNVFNLEMPGISGLDGSRTYTGAQGAFTVAAGEGGTGGVNNLTFPAVSARYVRMLGIKPGTQYGYSIYAFQVFAPDGTTDLAQGKPTTASSYTPAYPPANATDGNATTRWAVAVADRSVGGSWLQVDLGAATEIDHATISWEVAYGAAYAVQTSLDGSTWTDAVAVPTIHRVDGGWINVDGRAAFVVRGSGNPLTVTADLLTLSDGPAAGAAGMVVEGYPAQSPSRTAALAARTAPSAGGGGAAAAGLAASTVEDHLSLFNLSGQALGTSSAPVELTVPRQAGAPQTLLYRGTQTTSTLGSVYEVVLPAASARVEGPRFALTGSVPAGVVAEVADSVTVTLTAPKSGGCRLNVQTLAAVPGNPSRVVVLSAGESRQVTFPGAATPTADLALGRTTYPTSPLPAGMSDPASVVDGNVHTSWRPGTDGARMVVDLGAATALGALSTTWTEGVPVSFTVAVSTDGLTYAQAGSGSSVHERQPLTLNTTARYVALTATHWSEAGATLTSMSITA